MTNDTTANTAGCILCPDGRYRLPNRPPVCDACRSWLAGLIGDIRILAEQLVAPEAPLRDLRAAPMLEPGWVDGHAIHDRHAARDKDGALVLRWRDPLGTAVPAGTTTGQHGGPRVASAPGSRPPTGLDRIDLAAPARLPNPVRGLSYYPRSLWPEDQVGHQSIATMLDEWVREWVATRARGEHLPTATVDALTRWLAHRVEWACDEHPAIGDFAAEMRHLRSDLRGILGLSERPDYLTGVPCPQCDLLALYRRNGSVWVECSNCPNLLSPEEYADWLTRAIDESPSAREVA